MRSIVIVMLAACGDDSHVAVDARPGDGAVVDGTIIDGATDSAVVDAPPAAGTWQLSIGGVGSCALHTTDGRVKCWGGMAGYEVSTFYGDAPNEMGDHLGFIDLGTGVTVKQLSVGSDYACAITNTDRVKCWGNNQYGQLGIGDMRDRGRAVGDMGDALPFVDFGAGRTVKQVSVGDWNACVILDNNKLKCWGLNAAGTCGYGVRRGATAATMGDALPYVDLGAGRSPKFVSAGENRVCVLLDNDAIKCWGNDSSGALGRAAAPMNIGNMPNQMGDNLAPVALGSSLTPSTIIPLGEGACVQFTNGKLKCWGRNTEGELALADTNHRGDAAGEMGDALPFTMLPTNPISIMGGAGHACAVFTDNTVGCWGSNYAGTLGLGVNNNVAIGDMAAEVGTSMQRVSLAGPVKSVVGQGLTTCAILVDDHIQCWGSNSIGQLGIGDTRDRGNLASDMGANLPFLDLGP